MIHSVIERLPFEPSSFTSGPLSLLNYDYCMPACSRIKTWLDLAFISFDEVLFALSKTRKLLPSDAIVASHSEPLISKIYEVMSLRPQLNHHSIFLARIMARPRTRWSLVFDESMNLHLSHQHRDRLGVFENPVPLVFGRSQLGNGFDFEKLVSSRRNVSQTGIQPNSRSPFKRGSGRRCLSETCFQPRSASSFERDSDLRPNEPLLLNRVVVVGFRSAG